MSSAKAPRQLGGFNHWQGSALLGETGRLGPATNRPAKEERGSPEETTVVQVERPGGWLLLSLGDILA